MFPIFVKGGSLSIKNSSISCDYVCDFINIKQGKAFIESCRFYGSFASNTDAIDLDNVSNAIVKNNRIYNFKGHNSDGIDIGQNSNYTTILGQKSRRR